jgi:hypothetical protein
MDPEYWTGEVKSSSGFSDALANDSFTAGFRR